MTKVSRPWLDRLGTVASSTCALHCVAMALAPALLPLVGLGFLHDERAEWAFVACAVAFAGLAAWFGHQTHRRWSITVGFAAGMLALVGARVGEELGLGGSLGLALAGGGVLVASHLVNLRRCQACQREATCSTG